MSSLPESAEDLAAFNERVVSLISQPDTLLVDLRGVEEIEKANDSVKGEFHLRDVLMKHWAGTQWVIISFFPMSLV